MTRYRVTRIGVGKPKLPAKSPRKTLRKSRIKPKPRSASEYARIYGSKERVEWVKAQPCVVDGRRPSDNAHTENEGLSRKAHYTTIIPLCRQCHVLSHHGWSWLGFTTERRKELAAETERRWQSHIESLQEKQSA